MNIETTRTRKYDEPRDGWGQTDVGGIDAVAGVTGTFRMNTRRVSARSKIDMMVSN